ncbi:MAG: exosortase/archaeosortase family protein [Candidatus Omnitrophica bacterium]|nr:exosortase/archaeosortase family protein [Candidatus Omnitrophota bacterium]
MMIKRSGTMVKFLSCIALLLVAYIPTILWMADRWFAKESYYGHGFLIPIVSLVIAWQRRDILKKIRPAGAIVGLWTVAACLLTHIACASLKVYFISGFSFVLAIYGLILFFFGKEMVRNLTFPIFFLLAMIPLPLVVVGNLTVKLKLFAAQAATFILNHIGFPSVRNGSIIRMPNSFIAVEAPCSGLRSLISLLTLGLLFAYVTKISPVKKAALFLSSVPIALASNVIRIILLATVNDLYGEKVAMGFFHDFTGFLVFAVAFSGLYGVSRLLEPKKNAG